MKKVKLIYYFIVVLPIILLLMGYVWPSSFFNNQESIRNFVEGFGFWSPFIFILLQIFQVVITPISHYVVSLAGGFIFGPWAGALYNWIGRSVGTIIAFYIARKFGRNLVSKFIQEESFKKYDKFFEKNKILLFLIYFLPFFPDDEISYLAGLSKIDSKSYIFIVLLGQISGSFSLAYTGAGIQSIKDPVFIALSVITLIGGVLFVWINKKQK